VEVDFSESTLGGAPRGVSDTQASAQGGVPPRDLEPLPPFSAAPSLLRSEPAATPQSMRAAPAAPAPAAPMAASVAAPTGHFAPATMTSAKGSSAIPVGAVLVAVVAIVGFAGGFLVGRASAPQTPAATPLAGTAPPALALAPSSSPPVEAPREASAEDLPKEPARAMKASAGARSGAATTGHTESTPAAAAIAQAPASQPWESSASSSGASSGSKTDASAARAALTRAAAGVGGCAKAGGPTGRGTATVTFNPDGSVGDVRLSSAFRDTPAENCIESKFRSLRVAPFADSPTALTASFMIQ